MVSHVVLLKPRADLTADEGQLLIAAFRRATRDIPTILDVRIGRRIVHGAGYEPQMPDTADYFIALDFATLADLQAYLVHPAHEELGMRFNTALRAALVYDFELTSIDRLGEPR